ncbi:transglycosylase domain-containing protein [Actinacidiphila cocklensis]|uniref:Penicillin-insensitive transglycosylase n=1 Tax=Actinacidiphila cocklensis TaxID=887465 RepID=A0A9W4DL96_9ACTN|nr:transglycosylase domain-containing protein [Actinacidiphila cocklensis]WSX78147.1 penicillin-binding protein [Streptomyces sp. NBC_00899]CAG6393500.1 Penicillin-insensitive transglycosylase [Actinacidiphila cocklensis]
MSEHRRKPPPQSPAGGRAAARRGGQQPTPPPSGGRRAAGGPPAGARSERDTPTGSPSGAHGGSPAGPSRGSGGDEPYQGRAAARRAAQGGRAAGRRRGAGSGPGGAGAEGRGGRGPGRRPTKKRFIDYPRFGKEGWRHWMPSWRQVTAVAVGFVGTLVGIVGIAYAMVDVPDVNKASEAQNNVYYWADGTRMVTGGGSVNRQNVPYEKIPKAMRYAVISAENKTFETDSGVDPMGIARALFNMAKGGETQGGSTITQQYVKNTMLDQSQTISRKFKELFISIKVGAKFSKNEIITGYLNTSYFGRNAYGIQAAAQTYYGVDAEKLNPSQCAMLATLLKGPTYYDPNGNPSIDPAANAAANTARATSRWASILDNEVRFGHMTAVERAKYTKFPMPQGLKAQAGMNGQIGYLVDTANHYVEQHSKPAITKEDLDRGGYQIYTTFEKDKVNELKTSVETVRAQRIKPGEGHKYTGDQQKEFGGDADTNVQFGAASVVPGDGKIVAIYGGAGMDKGEFNNNADTQGVPVGSTFKPFVLAAAMTYGTNYSDNKPLTPDSKYNANDLIPIKDHNGDWVENKDHSIFKQKNESGTKWGYVTLNKAMEESINSPFVQLGEDVGLNKVKETAVKAGLLGDYAHMGDMVASYSIGTATPSAIRMANAYGTFADSGDAVEPYSVTKVVHDGDDDSHFQKPKRTKTPALDPDVADTVTKVLQNVVKKGTGKKALELGRTAAGKTGTTDTPGGTRSAWFVGYTQQLSTSVVMFRQDSKASKLLPMAGTGGPTSTTHGGDIPATMWTDYMKAALGNQPDPGFPTPGKLGDGKTINESGAPTPTPSMTTPPPTTPPPPPTNTPPTNTPPTNTPTWTPPTTPTQTPTTPQCGLFNPNCNTTPPTSPTATPTTSPPGRNNGGANGAPNGG